MKSSRLTPKSKPHVQHPHQWPEKLLHTIAERDLQLLGQLTQINKNIERMMHESQSQHREALAAMLSVVNRLGGTPIPVPIASSPLEPMQPTHQSDEHTYQNPSDRKISKHGLGRRRIATTVPFTAAVTPSSAQDANQYFGSEQKSNSTPRNYQSGDSVHSRPYPHQQHYQASYTEYSDQGEWEGHNAHYIRGLSPRRRHQQSKKMNPQSSSEHQQYKPMQPTQITQISSAGFKKKELNRNQRPQITRSESEGDIRSNRHLGEFLNKQNQIEEIDREMQKKMTLCQQFEELRKRLQERHKNEPRDKEKSLLAQRLIAVNEQRKLVVEAMQELTRKRESLVPPEEEKVQVSDEMKLTRETKPSGVMVEDSLEKRTLNLQQAANFGRPPLPPKRQHRNLFIDIPVINGEVTHLGIQDNLGHNVPAVASTSSIKIHTDPQIQLVTPVDTHHLEKDFESQPILVPKQISQPQQVMKGRSKQGEQLRLHPIEGQSQETLIVVTKPSSAEWDKQSSPQLKKGITNVGTDTLGTRYLTPRGNSSEHGQRMLESELVLKAQVSSTPFPRLQSKLSRESFEKDDMRRSSAKDAHPGMTFPTRLALVQFEEKELIVDIHPIVAGVSRGKQLDLTTATLSISKWVAEVYDTLSKETFSGYFSRHLSEPDAKVFFTHNLALNFEHMIEYFWVNHKELWVQVKDSLIRHFETESSNTLEFMMVKYPQKRKTYISEEIRNAIPVKNESEDPEFDVIRNTGNYFEFDPTKKSYCKKVKILLNRLMTESQKHLPEFRRLMKGIFTVQRGGFDYQLKNLIGMKFKENSPLYTKKEIEEEGIQIKAPEILRIIIKWIQELERKVRNLGGGISIHNSFTVKKDGSSDHLNKLMKEDVKNFMAKKMVLLDQAEDEMRLRIRSMLSLFPQYLDKYMNNFAYIKPTEVKSGLLSFVLSETASNLSINYLIFIIDLLEEASVKSKRFDGKGQVTVNDNNGNSFKENVQYKDFEFVTFTISDLLRCKCSGSLAEMKEVWLRLSTHPKLRVYRVKNRLDTSNRDFLINARLMGTPILCEIQLSIMDKSVDEKQTYLNHFSHFIYELSRASYGPIAEAVIINSYLTEFVSFFRESLSRITENRKPLQDLHVECSQSGVMSIEGYVQRNNNFTFVCSNCLELRIANTRHLYNFDSSYSILAHDEQMERTDKMKHIICGDCAFSNLSPTQQSAFLLRTPLSFFFVSADQQLEIDYPIICAVQRCTSNRKIVVMQRSVQEKSVIFVPVFYECETDKVRIPLKSLKEKYYVFKLKPELSVALIDSRRFVGEVFKDKQTFEILETVMDSIMTPLLHRPEMDEEQRFLTEYKDRQVVFSADQMNVDELLKLNCQKLQIVMSLDFNYMLVLNAHHTQQELAKMIKKGRELKEVDINAMMKISVWNLENSNLDNESFEIPLFNQDINHITEIKGSENNFTKLHFMSSQTLRRLDLSINAIRKLQLEERDFPSLEILNLSSNIIDIVVSVHHYTLRSLILGSNRIAKVHQENWRLPSLEQLQIADNSIKSLNVGKMKCPKLRELDAWQNKIEHFELPTSMYFLEGLNLAGNCLRQLNFTHVRFSSLKRLLLGRNQLDSLKLPDSMESLEELSVTQNRLQSFDLSRIRIFRIRVVDLSHNRLEFADLPEDLDSLETLNLSHNEMRHLCLSKMHFKSLRDLNAEFNPIEDIFLPQRLQKLECMNFAHCQFTTIDLVGCATPRLKSLCFESNKIESLRLPTNLSTLQELCVSDNCLKSLDIGSIELSELRFLNASKNQIKELALPVNLPKLEKFNLSHNWITALDISSIKLPSIKHINLECNLLGSVTFPSDTTCLESIHLNHNRLAQLDLSHMDLSALKLLDISTNMLTMLILNEATTFSQLSSIKSKYNPFISPIPSNLLIVRSDKFPILSQVEVGISDPILATLWLLWMTDLQERNQLYKSIERTTSHTVNNALIEAALLTCWEEADISAELRAQLLRMLKYLHGTQAIPEIYLNQMRV